MNLPDPTDARSTDHGPTDGDTSRGAAAPTEIIRSEERLQVGTALRPTRRLRLRKRVVSEEVTHTVTVRREELVIDEEDLDGADLVPGGDHDFGGHDYEIVLHEERVVTATRVVPVERVRVRVSTSTEDVAVSEVLQREQVDLETMPRTEIRTPDGD
jgi:uncharacterized protein (TIGR02271 family)